MMRRCRIATLLTAGLVACGGAAEGPQAGPQATGDQSVFASHEIAVRIAEQEHVDSGRAAAIPPVYLSTSVYVVVNGGDSAGRVEGLKVWIDGEEVEETGSAAAPPSYSFQHYVRDSERGHAYRVEVRHAGAMFATTIRARAVTIVAPTADSVVSATDTVTMRWSAEGPGEATPSVYGQHYGETARGSCAVQYDPLGRGESDAVFRPEVRDIGQPPPCTGEASVVWHASETIDGPFRKLVVSHDTSRLRRFEIR